MKNPATNKHAIVIAFCATILVSVVIAGGAGNILESAAGQATDGTVGSNDTGTSQANATSGVNIVLVHGAWEDGSSWRKVIPILRDAGHKVIAVQLPLHSVADDVATVRRAITLLGEPTILVGHSYGGFIITNAAYNQNVDGLVYIAAFAPDEGEAIIDSVDFAQRPQDFFIIDADGFQYINQTYFRQAISQDVNSTEADLMAIVQKPAHDSLLTEQSGPPAWRQVPSWYQISEGDNLIPPDVQRRFAERMDATTVSLNSSHVSPVSNPDEVAELILNATNTVER